MLTLVCEAAFVGVTLLLGILIIIFPYDYSWLLRISDTKKIERIPGPKTVPFFGNMLMFSVPPEQLLNVLLGLHKKYSPVFRIWIMGFPEVFIKDPDDVEIILSSGSHITKSLDYNLLQPWLGTGLLTSSGDKWHSHRKILTAAFHFKILEEYIHVFNSNSQALVQKLEEHIKQPFVDITPYITMCTLDIICETAMGVSVQAQRGGQAEYIKAVKRISELVVHRQMAPWLHRRFIFKLMPSGQEQAQVLRTLHGFTENVMRERKSQYRASRSGGLRIAPAELTGVKRHMTFLDMLIEVSEKKGLLTDTDIREEVDTFMFEGHDTTSAAISWAIFTLGSHPDVQEKVINELREIFGDSDRDATYDDLQKMKYMEQVIKETLRLYPSVPGICRKLDVDVRIKNYTIPAGTSIPIIPYVIHRNPKIFPNPEEFNPDHFLPERIQGRHPFAYIPFSAGPRNCIGQRFALLEEKAVLSTVLRKFKLESLSRKEEMDLMFQLILRPKHGLKIKITPR